MNNNENENLNENTNEAVGNTIPNEAANETVDNTILNDAANETVDNTIPNDETYNSVYRYSKEYYDGHRDENNSFKIDSDAEAETCNNSGCNSQSGTYDNTTYNQTYQYSYNENVSANPKDEKKRARKLKKQQRKMRNNKSAKRVVASVASVAAVAVVSVASSYATVSYLNAGKSDDVIIQATNTGSFNDKSKDISQMTTTTGSSTLVTTDISSMVSEVMSSVVTISNTGTESVNTFFGQSQTYQYTSSGSGIIVGKNDSELLVVTNAHVISGADTINVSFVDGKEYVADVKGSDSTIDIAVIAISLDDLEDETKEKIKIATLGNSNNLTVGEPAIAIGNAMGYGQSVTTGVISALNREVTVDDVTNTLIQTDAAINPGNSGGALLNLAGEVIGINSVKFTSTEVEGMGYAIPISDVADVINELMNKQTKKKVDADKSGYLGIKAMEITSSVASQYNMPEGIYVADVEKDAAAEKAGIEKGDIITKIEGTTVSSVSDLTTELEYYEAGTEVEIVIQKQIKNSYGYEEKTVKVKLDKASE